MALPESLVKDQVLRKAVIAGVVLVIGACILSQTMMQLGGGSRDEPMNLSSKITIPCDDTLSPSVILLD